MGDKLVAWRAAITRADVRRGFPALELFNYVLRRVVLEKCTFRFRRGIQSVKTIPDD